MKNTFFTLAVILIFAFNTNAQNDTLKITAALDSLTTPVKKDTLWRTSVLTALNLNQLSLTNWAAGGDNSLAGNTLLSFYAKYKKGKWVWDNLGDFGFGGNKVDAQKIRKTDDKIDINSKVGHDCGKNIFLSYILGFKTQFTEGFFYNDSSRERISNFLAPAYVLNSLGLDWKPNNNLSIFLSVVTVKTTIVQDDLLSASGQYGVEPGKKSKHEIGAYFIAQHQHTLMENIVFSNKVEFFTNYRHNPENIDVNWEVMISLKVNKWISAFVQTHLIYDDDVFIPKTDASHPPGPGIQFKEAFGIGLAYTFDNI